MDDNWIILFFLWYYLFGLTGQEAAFPHSMVGQTFSLSVVPLLWRLSGEPPPGLHLRSVPETNGCSDEQLNLIFAGTPGELWWGKHLPAQDGQRQDPLWFTVSSSQIPVLFHGLIEAAEVACVTSNTYKLLLMNLWLFYSSATLWPSLISKFIANQLFYKTVYKRN